jgi:23S rRNA pseudouridine1911/1915/1917 synthase
LQTSTFPRTRIHQENFFIDTAFRVIHEDTSILVIDKPSPLAVHPVGSYAELNLHSLLKKDERWKNASLRFVHRLDAETSGVVVIAKTPEAARFLGIQFLKGLVRKKYHALVFGVPREENGEIRLPLGNDTSSGFQTVRVLDAENGQDAATRYRVLWTKDAYSYLEVEPLTGRTHQIRAHLSLIGHPIVGDKIYIDLGIFQRYVVNGLDGEMLARLKLPRLALHASEICLKHPETQTEVGYHSEAPDFLKGITK